MLKLRQYFCMHVDLKMIAKHRSVNMNLWRCDKCGVYCIQLWTIGAHHMSKTPVVDGWIYK
jgi:hypothetical protein